MTGIFYGRNFQILLIKVVTVALFLAAWQIIASAGILYEGVVPQPVLVIRALAAELVNPTLHRDVGYTLLEAGLGFLFGSAIAIAVGLWLGSSAFSRRAFEPYLLALASMPKVIFLPILFLVFGLGIESKIAKSAMSAFFPTAIGTITAYLQINKVLINVGRSFDLTLPQMVRMIYIPAMLRPLIVALQLSMAMSIIGVLSAEIAYAQVGIGARLIRYADQFNISAMYAVMIVIFAICATINYGFIRAQAPFLRYERSRESDTAAPARPFAGDQPATT